MTALIICRWCGMAIEPNAPRYRLFQSRSTRVVGRWVAHFHPQCGAHLLAHLADRQPLGTHFGDPCAVVTMPPRRRA